MMKEFNEFKYNDYIKELDENGYICEAKVPVIDLSVVHDNLTRILLYVKTNTLNSAKELNKLNFEDYDYTSELIMILYHLAEIDEITADIGKKLKDAERKSDR